MTASRMPWEKFYPPGAHWDIETEPGTLTDFFLDIVARSSDRDALGYNGTTITYADLGSAAARIADAFRRDGIGRGDAVALYLPNCPYYVFFFFGVLLAGARVTNLSPLDAPMELIHKCRDSGARTVVTLDLPALAEAAAALHAEGVVERVIQCDDARFGPAGHEPAGLADGVTAYGDFVAGTSDALTAVPVDPGDVALLQYTGGTTGTPKAAMLSHANLTAAVASYTQWYLHDPARGERNVVLLVLPLFHIFALSAVLLRQLSRGALVLLRQRFDPARVLDDIERHKVTAISGVPTMWLALVNTPDLAARDLSSLREVSSGGAPLPVELYRKFRDATGIRLRGGWGMTETSPVGTTVPLDTPIDKIGTIGIPLPGMLLDIVDLEDPRKVLPPGETGELRAKGPTVTKGYWNRPEETAAAFVDGHLLTGDICRMDEDGFFYLVDRKKDMILSGGFNVYPQMLEQEIYRHPAVRETMVIGVPDDYRGEAAKAFVVLRAGAERFTLDELREFLADKLGKHELPQHLEFRDGLPRTSVGKLARRELREAERVSFEARLRRKAQGEAGEVA